MSQVIDDDPRIIEFDVRTDEMLVNMGPQHPSTHGVLRLVLRTDGEIVSEIEPHIGYLHRCAEKIGENVSARQFIPYTDRMDYLAAMNMNLGWSLAVEKLMGLQVTEKARHLRVLISEFSRIASHLVGMGAYGLDLGTFSPFLYAFREREKILDLFEEACGARLTYSYITVGGLTADLPPGWLARCEAFLDQFEPVIREYHTLLTTNAIFVKRTAGIGVLSPEMAINYGCSGPVLRGSGVDHGPFPGHVHRLVPGLVLGGVSKGVFTQLRHIDRASHRGGQVLIHIVRDGGARVDKRCAGLGSHVRIPN